MPTEELPGPGQHTLQRLRLIVLQSRTCTQAQPELGQRHLTGFLVFIDRRSDLRLESGGQRYVEDMHCVAKEPLADPCNLVERYVGFPTPAIRSGIGNVRASRKLAAT